MSLSDFSLFMFSVDPEVIRPAMRAGVAGVVVDWEDAGKARRQHGRNTEVNHYTADDLRRARRATDGLVICRVNGRHDGSAAEIESAIALGADELLLPMVRTVEDVEWALDRIGGRRALGILIETGEAVRLAGELCALPLSRVYVGLNDLAIDRGVSNIFSVVGDGTVAMVRRQCPRPFGFGGLTAPDKGHPIPCRLLIAEMARLDTSFSFLRRSFHRDMAGRDLSEEVPRLVGAVRAAASRPPEQVARDHDDLVAAISAWPAAVAACERGTTPRISVVVPVYRNASTLEELHQRLREALASHGPVEMIYVNDACPDGSLEVLRRLACADADVRVLALPRRGGQHHALASGVAAARGQIVVMLDADLQDPPEAIPALVARLNDGYGAVYAGRRGAYESRGRLGTSRLFKHLVSRLTGMPPDAGAFVAMTRDVAARAAAQASKTPYLTSLIALVGQPVTSVPVERAPRPSGYSAYSAAGRAGLAARALSHALRVRLATSWKRSS